MNYQTLKAGDILQYGDEKRVKHIGHIVMSGSNYKVDPGAWDNLIVIGRIIIGGDLAHLEFRRPIK